MVAGSRHSTVAALSNTDARSVIMIEAEEEGRILCRLCGGRRGNEGGVRRRRGIFVRHHYEVHELYMLVGFECADLV